MLETVGAASLNALMAETLPSSIRQQAPLDLGCALSLNYYGANGSVIRGNNIHDLYFGFYSSGVGHMIIDITKFITMQIMALIHTPELMI